MISARYIGSSTAGSKALEFFFNRKVVLQGHGSPGALSGLSDKVSSRVCPRCSWGASKVPLKNPILEAVKNYRRVLFPFN